MYKAQKRHSGEQYVTQGNFKYLTPIQDPQAMSEDKLILFK